MIHITDTLSLPDEAATSLSQMVNATFATITGAVDARATSDQEWAELRKELTEAAGAYIFAVGQASEKFLRWQKP